MNAQIEAKARIAAGEKQVSLVEFNNRLKELGYKLDRSGDCKSITRYVSGDRAGFSYPTCNMSVREIDTGKSAFHFEARRDDKFNAFQALRNQIFGLNKDRIYEI